MNKNGKIDKNEVREFIRNSSPGTKFYFGADSERMKIDGKWYADYTLVIVAHLNGRNGGHLFAEMVREPDFDRKFNRPALRLMNEVYKISELFLEFKEDLAEHEYEIHLDVNKDKKFGSSCIVDEAIGYVRGVCGCTPEVKPKAWAASFGADRARELGLARLPTDEELKAQA